METQIKRLLSTIYLFISTWVIVITLAVAAIFYLLKAILVWVIPLVGYPTAYLFCSILCAIPVGMAIFHLRSRRLFSSNTVNDKEETGSPEVPNIESIRVLVQRHPFEAVAVAFTLGFSLDNSDDLRAIAGTVGRQAAQR